jgi:hypothetical protein
MTPTDLPLVAPPGLQFILDPLPPGVDPALVQLVATWITDLGQAISLWLVRVLGG